MGVVSELIDTTEMYLRTVYELEEEGILPLRARIAERLHQSGPTVSQTVARMERDGLIKVDVFGLEWEDVHSEACRWELVMSDAVELRLLKILDNPTESPYGNPIPGLEELQTSGIASDIGEFRIGVEPLDKVLDQATGDSVRVLVRRIADADRRRRDGGAAQGRRAAGPRGGLDPGRRGCPGRQPRSRWRDQRRDRRPHLREPGLTFKAVLTLSTRCGTSGAQQVASSRNV